MEKIEELGIEATKIANQGGIELCHFYYDNL